MNRHLVSSVARRSCAWGRAAGGPRKSNRRSYQASIEPVEPRTMLSGASGVFATIDQAAGSTTGCTIDLTAPAFRRTADGKLLVTIVCSSTGGGIAPMSRIPVESLSGGRSVRALSEQVGESQAVCVAALAPGPYEVNSDSPAASRFSFRLAGDVNGDFRVGDRDLVLLKKLVRSGDSAVSLGAVDVNGDGKLSKADLRLAALNRGAVTSTRPLIASAKLDASSDPNGDGVVVTPSVTIRGTAAPGSKVQLVSDDGASFSQLNAVSRRGTFSATVGVPMGD